MAVALDANSTAPSTAAAATTVDHTNLTVGSGSNRALVVQLTFSNQSITGITVTWDQGGTNQSVASIGAINTPGGLGRVLLYGLVAPTSGNRTLRVSWTGASDIIVNAVAYSGANQTGGTTTFAHFNSATGSTPSTTPSLTITSATGNATVEVMTDDGADPSAPNQRQTHLNTSMNVPTGGSRAAGAATVTHTWSLGGTSNWGQVGVDIVASGTATNISMPAGQLRITGVAPTLMKVAANDARIVFGGY